MGHAGHDKIHLAVSASQQIILPLRWTTPTVDIYTIYKYCFKYVVYMIMYIQYIYIYYYICLYNLISWWSSRARLSVPRCLVEVASSGAWHHLGVGKP